ncbi:hypothetical protein GCM10020221_31150 [Streptomyces thioluteus]|uniref:Uncharacterized protein n=1 Tax=Streptomyces thioluteus TaxID=66431 RepID=A0ABN3WZT3_STRTU
MTVGTGRSRKWPPCPRPRDAAGAAGAAAAVPAPAAEGDGSRAEGRRGPQYHPPARPLLLLHVMCSS